MKRVLAVAGTLTIVASLIPLAASLWWVFELFTHFRVQLVAAELALVLLFAARRAWRWCAALAACMVVNAAPILPYLRPATAIAASGEALTVLTVNVQSRNDEYAGLLASITQTEPDLVLVVEFTERWRAHLAGLKDRYPYQFTHARADPFGIALLSRHPLDWARAVEVGPTSAIDAGVKTAIGTVRLLGVHLVPPTSAGRARERNAQLVALAERAADRTGPLIVLGDFNLSPYSPYFDAWLARSALSDTRKGLDFTWPSFFPLLGIPIDHCFVSDDFIVTEYRRLERFGSDHYPLLVRLVQEHAT